MFTTHDLNIRITRIIAINPAMASKSRVANASAPFVTSKGFPIGSKPSHLPPSFQRMPAFGSRECMYLAHACVAASDKVDKHGRPLCCLQCKRHVSCEHSQNWAEFPGVLSCLAPLSLAIKVFRKDCSSWLDGSFFATGRGPWELIPTHV